MNMSTTAESKPMRLSRRARAALKLDSREPIYKVAQRADVNPALVSRWIHGVVPVRRDDPRVARLAAALGMTLADAIEPVPRPRA